MECGPRLENESTENILCEVHVNCGCTITAPFSWIFEALTTISGSSLGTTTAIQSKDNRIELRDRLGLVQVGDLGKAFKVIAFGGNAESNGSFARTCRKTIINEDAVPMEPWPRGRALMRDYEYVPTQGSGNLLIYKSNPLGDYRVIGVCIDDRIANKKGHTTVTIK